MKKLVAIALVVPALALGSPAASEAGASTDAALALGSFAVLNQLLRGETVLHDLFGRGRPAPVVVQGPPAVVYAPPPPPRVVYAPPPPAVVYAPPPPPAVVYAAPPRVVYAPASPVIYAPGPVLYAPGPPRFIPPGHLKKLGRFHR